MFAPVWDPRSKAASCSQDTDHIFWAQVFDLPLHSCKICLQFITLYNILYNNWFKSW